MVRSFAEGPIAAEPTDRRGSHTCARSAVRANLQWVDQRTVCAIRLIDEGWLVTDRLHPACRGVAELVHDTSFGHRTRRFGSVISRTYIGVVQL